jgi:hypothetical protein
MRRNLIGHGGRFSRAQPGPVANYVTENVSGTSSLKTRKTRIRILDTILISPMMLSMRGMALMKQMNRPRIGESHHFSQPFIF